ncbi:MAG: HAD-IIIC family phosphatase [Oscillospiraceae bacterium]|nr:HAD-IIIC family phosphatase [Oscillospiraceae bacterium]
MNVLSYPFDSAYILKKKKSLKKELLSSGSGRIRKKIAVLGGSTTNEIVNILELFLLSYGIEPEFYQSEYAQYWQDAVFGNEELDSFEPDIVYIHTTSRNLTGYTFSMSASEKETEEMAELQYRHFEEVWTAVKNKFGCPVIQNNFEMPFYRILGNSDASDIHGKIHFISILNEKFCQYARENENFHICDINYISACYGLEKWHDTSAWYMYKYAMNTQAIPEFAFNLSNIIKSVFGKNKKMIVLDLDNTLWGGVVGDCGQQGIEIGHETGIAEGYTEFQKYIRDHKQLGILLAVNSKNDMENAVDGLNHPDTVLTPDDFVSVKANWNSKDRNIEEISEEISILPDSFVFIDDNPAERHIVSEQINGIAVPEIGSIEEYIKVIDRNGYFELTSYTADDVKRNEMYRANLQRARNEKKFSDYGEYLLSLDMEAYIDRFDEVSLARITQLTNKSNQFNLTTRRYTQSEMEAVFTDDKYIKIYGRLADKFGDNGIVSVIIGRIENSSLHIDLWLMSCRVLKREMEYAMLDRLVEICRKNNITEINGYYYKTAKNNMVKNLFTDFGFTKISEDENENASFVLRTDNYTNLNKSIKVKCNGGY